MPFLIEGAKEKLLNYACEMNIELTPFEADLLLKHVALLDEKNKVINLTRITDTDEVLIRHIIDSLLCVHTSLHLPITKESRFLDIGTGGGFPGIPIAVATGVDGLLIDRIGKKIAAVNEFIDEMELHNAHAQKVRAEELAKNEKNNFDFVFARACDHLGILIEYSSPLLVKHGLLVAAKGNLSLEELSEAQISADLCGMKIKDQFEFDLPLDNGHRTIILVEKISKPKISLPREAGVPKRKKLWLN